MAAARSVRMRRRRRRSLIVVLLVVALAVGVGVYLTAGGPSPASRAEPSARSGTGNPASAAWQRDLPPAPPVLREANVFDSKAARPTSSGLQTSLAAALADPALTAARIGLVVADPTSGEVLYRRGDAATYLPASTIKLATATAALTVLGPDHRLTTTVVRDGDRVILVGGGDPTLAGAAAIPPSGPAYPNPARLSALADQTAKALKAAGTTTVRVAYDASLYSGPALATSWKPTYVSGGDVAPVSALEVDGGRADPRKAIRSADPARAAADQFAMLLRAREIATTGAVASLKAPGGADVVATVQSPPVSALVAAMLGHSDNDIAEALGRHVAIASGRPATFDGAADAVRAAVVKLGIDGGDIRMADASGLSRADFVAPHVLTHLLALAISPQHPQLRTIVESLPVAGFSGTLALRYAKPPAQQAAGWVWAKTGTLADVSALAGYVLDADGRLLSFAALAGDMPRGAGKRTEAALDKLAATLAACGCR